MITFKEYVREYTSKVLKSGLPHPDWITKEILALVGVGVLFAFAIAFGIVLAKYLFLLLFVGIPPLILYSNYCNKRSGE